MGDLFSALRETKDGQSILLASCVSNVTLIQNNIPEWCILGQPAPNNINNFAEHTRVNL